MDRPQREEALLAAVSGPHLMEAVQEISKGVREAGSPAELESLHWLGERLGAWGYRTRIEHHPGYISLPVTARLEVAGWPEPVPCITHSFAASTPAGGLTAPVVPADGDGAGAAALQGAIALVSGMASPHIVQRMERSGTLAQIYVHDDHLHGTSLSPVWGNPTDETIGTMPATPSVSVRREDGERLAKRAAEGRLEATIHTEVDTAWRSIPLLTADLDPTEGPEAPFVLFSGHIDSWHQGAMDNGSANAAMLEVARVLAPHRAALRRGLRLAFWSGHSQGRYCGSAWYADACRHELAARCVAHVNIDSVGGRGATVVTEPPVMPQTSALAAEAVAQVTGERVTGKRLIRFGDQSFYGIGLNCLFATLSEQDAAATEGQVRVKYAPGRGGGLGWWWHTTEDTVDKIDPALLERDTRIYLVALHRLLCNPTLPFDYREAVGELKTTVAELADAAGDRFDLAPLQSALAALGDAVAAFHERLAALAESDAPRLAAADEALLRLSRHLVPIAFHEEGVYHPDPLEPLEPLPSLQPLRDLARLERDDPAAHALRTRLRRRCNWVLAEVQAAHALAQDALRRLA